MVSGRYSKEYRLDVADSPSGKKKTVLVYVGPYFDYDCTIQEHSKQKRKIVGFGILSLALFILGMSFYSNISKAWYVAIPFAVNAFILFLYFESVFYFWPFKTKLNREQKDKGGERFKPICLSSIFFYLISLVGSSVKLMALHTADAFDLIFLGCTVAEFVIMIFLFKLALKIKYVERENPVAKDWEGK